MTEEMKAKRDELASSHVDTTECDHVDDFKSGFDAAYELMNAHEKSRMKVLVDRDRWREHSMKLAEALANFENDDNRVPDSIWNLRNEALAEHKRMVETERTQG